MNRLLSLPVLLLVGACATVPQTTSVRPPEIAAPTYSTVGLEGVMGRDAAALARLFGTPQLDVREGPGRKLQFGGACVLDAYLYAQRQGAEPVVTHVDARRGDGQSVDRAACVASLAGRRAGQR